MSTEPANGSPQNPYRVSAPADILSLIPHTLGFEPRNSMVLMALHGGRLGATLRLDLPAAPGAAGARAAYALTAVRFLASDTGADGTLLVLYTDRPWTHPARPPFRPLVRQLENELDAAGLPVRDGWLVGPETWRDYFCVRPDCCPWPGRPRSQISDSMLNTELVYRGSAFAPSLDRAVAESFPPAWPNAREVLAAQERYAANLRGRWCGHEQFSGTLGLWADTIGDSGSAAPGSIRDTCVPYTRVPGTRAGHSVPGAREAELAGFLLAGLHDRTIRDTLLVMAAAGPRTAFDGAVANGLIRPQVHPPVFPGRVSSGGRGAGADVGPQGGDVLPAAGTEGAPCPIPAARAAGLPPAEPAALSRGSEAAGSAAERFRGILVGATDVPPDWAHLDAAHALFTDLVPVADGESAAALLSLLAWIEWARGRGSRAHLYLERALGASAGYRLALLLRELLGTGMLPDWAGTPQHAWPGPADT